MLSEAWRQAIRSFLSNERAGGKPETTVSARKHHLEHAARRLGPDPWAVSVDEIRDYFATQKWAQETRRGRRTTLTRFYDWAIEAGYTGTSPAARLPKVPMKAGRPRPAPERAYNAALRNADPRELLALRLAAEVGLRRAEVTKIHSDDLFEDEGGVSLLVHGKGDRDRTVPLPKSLGEALTALPYGYAFPGKDHGHLSPRYLGKLIARLLPDTLTMHTLRHRFATRLYARRRDILMVQQALGHSSVGTTQRYVQYDPSTMRAAIDEMADSA